MKLDAGWTDALTTLHEREAGSDLSIDRYSRACALDAIVRHAPERARILEVGSSSGFLLRDIRKALPRADITGSDVIEANLAKARERSGERVLFVDIVNCELEPASFDLVVAINVLEHVKNHETAAGNVLRVLKPGGVFVVEVPSGPGLYDGYDACLMHHRRYTRRSLRGLLRGAGFNLLEESAIGFIPYPAFWIVKKLNRLRFGMAPSEEIVRRAIKAHGDSVLVRGGLLIEGLLRGVFSFPFGIRQMAIAKKPTAAVR